MQIRLYTRRGCHLCEAAWDMLEAIGPALGAECVATDVDGDASVERLYGDRVPVLAVDGVVVLEGRFDEADIVRAVHRPVTGPVSTPDGPASRSGPPPT